MLKRLITWSIENRFIVLVLTAFVVVAGIVAVRRTPLEALPDLSDVQVIIQTEHEGQNPQIIEDQVTYPVASEMLKVPGAETVRGYFKPPLWRRTWLGAFHGLASTDMRGYTVDRLWPDPAADQPAGRSASTRAR